MELKSILKDLIQSRGITISALGRQTGLSPQTIHNWLAGAEPRSLKQVKLVADFFGVSMDYLCFGIEENPIEPLNELNDEINAGVFEVVLRRVKK